MHVKASLHVHEMEIEAEKDAIRELGDRVSENKRNQWESMGEIEAKVEGFAGAVETIFAFAMEAYERRQAKQEVPDSTVGTDGIRRHQRRVRESTGTNAPDTALTSSDRCVSSESAGFQLVFNVGVQVPTDDIQVLKDKIVTVSISKRAK